MKTRCIFRVFSCLTLGICSVSVRGNESLNENPIGRAYNLIDAALAETKTIPSYVCTSLVNRPKGTEKVVISARNEPDGKQWVRTERTITVPKQKPETTVFIQNPDGLFQLYEGGVIRLLFPAIYLGTPAPRFPTGQMLSFEKHVPYDETKHLACTMEENVDYFGMPCTRIAISVADSLRADLANYIQQSAGTGVAGAPAKAQRRPEPPASYVYYVLNSPKFIVCWQQFGLGGNKIKEVAYQDFKTESELPSALFAIPPVEKKFVATNPEEYARALAILNSARKRKS